MSAEPNIVFIIIGILASFVELGLMLYYLLTEKKKEFRFLIAFSICTLFSQFFLCWFVSTQLLKRSLNGYLPILLGLPFSWVTLMMRHGAMQGLFFYEGPTWSIFIFFPASAIFLVTLIAIRIAKPESFRYVDFSLDRASEVPE